MKDEGRKIWDSITDGSCIENPSLFARFFVLSFADIKKYKFYYYLAYPSVSQTVATITDPNASTDIKHHFSNENLKEITGLYRNIAGQIQKSFFILERNADGFSAKQLIDYIKHNDKESNFKDVDLNSIYFCCADSTSSPTAAWPLRLFVVALVHLCPHLRGKDVQIVLVRFQQAVGIEKSLLFNVTLSKDDIDLENLTWIGYERDNAGKILPKTVDMAASMDPEKLAKSSVQLNLKLMKWRLLPDLNLETIASTKCLLMGAGTLGCSVSRNLLAWGVDVITFVDYGKVSRSNPVRQSLFTYEDALNGGKDKAKTAAARLKEISPGVQPSGYNLHIPMPGHTIGEAIMEETLATIKKLEELVQSHDVIFLLTDSRESRWLPTLLGAAYNKIVINAALGFDSYLVMRHGTRSKDVEHSTAETIDGLKCIPGNQLGCYFCNDITAPGDSMKDRTLDMQCTVTRPGVSNIAGSLAAELLISILQHRQGAQAPAYFSVANSTDGKSIPEGLLGIIPHSIRGMMSTYTQILPATEKFTQCVACSEKVLNEYAVRGNEFLLDVFGSNKYLEDLTGISEMINESHDIIELDDSDFEMSD
ncbi:hypothetical protein HA402_000386 [Bradysia odoriphaga]|nr:hypothetical protein HA402_000386 [Bradysia odoriphaga]